MPQVDSAPAVFMWHFGPARFDEAARELHVGGEVVDLEPRPLEILLELLRHAGEVVTKEDLLDAVYGHRHLSDGAVAQAIRRLRRALGDDAQTLIATVHRVGYKLIAPVTRTEAPGRRLRPLLLKAGDRVPRREHWRLLEPLGGAEVEVWLIEHEKTHARRVLKMATDAVRLSALKREVTLFRVLKDALGARDDLVTLIDWSFDASPFFTECDYGGVTLVEWAEGLGGLATVDLDVRVGMVAGAADAVAAAHSANVLHKDLKPTNILAYQTPSGDWRPRLIDFGSGRLLDVDRLAALRITQMGFTQQIPAGEDSMSGTPLYLAPELVAGQMPTVKSDVYALGVILYQMAVGDFRRPVASGWEDDIADPVLRADIAAATHGNPVKRLSSAAELAERLRCLDARRVAPVPGGEAVVARRGRFVAWMALGLVGAGLAGWQVHVHRHPTEIPLSAVAGREAVEEYQRIVTITHRRHQSEPDYQTTAAALQRLVDANPRFANAWAQLAQVHAHLYFNHVDTELNRAAATRALEKAVELQPEAPDTLIARGYVAYWIDADYAAAERLMRRVHAQWPEKQDATIALARIARRQNRYEEVARYFEEALVRDPMNFELTLGAAHARLALEQFPAALKLAGHALDIEPTDLQAIGLKARIFQAQGNLDAADEVLTALPKRPGDFATVSLRAEQQRLMRRFPAGIDLWTAYLDGPDPGSEQSDRLTARRELAHLLLLTGNTAAARVMLKDVRDDLETQRISRPADPFPVGSLALVYADLGERALARTLAEAAANFEVVKNDALRAGLFTLIRASVAARTGDVDQAFRMLHESLLHPSFDAVTPGLLAIDPEWNSLHADARYAALIKHAPL